MTLVGRAKLDHPALDTAGGVGLHTSIEAIYTAIANHLSGRFFSAASVANSVTTTFEHNFGANLAELQLVLYTGTTPTGTLVPNPKAAGWTIAETSGFEKIKIDVTAPSSGGPHTFHFILVHVSDVKERAEALNGIQPTYAPSMVGEVRIDSVYGIRWIATGVSAATDWKRQVPGGVKAIVNSNVGYGTHTTLASALADSNVVDGDEIIQETNETVNTTISFTKKVHVRCKPGVTFTKGSATTGFNFASGSSSAIIEHARFAGFTTGGDKPVNIATGVANVKVLFPVFATGQASDITDVDGNSLRLGELYE